MKNLKIGYLRVSTEEQKPDRQIDALAPICDELHIEKLSAVAKSRPVYEEVIRKLKSGDIFVIWDLDRAYRSAKDALIELDLLRERGIEIQIASLQIDTATPYGKLIYTFISGLAEFERNLLSERTKQGLESAKKNGVILGRRPKMTIRQIRNAKKKLDQGNIKLKEIAKQYKVHPWTLTRSIKRLDATTSPK